MNKFEINGTEYKLRFDMYAMELIEEQLGSIQSAFDSITKGQGLIKTMSAMFVAMANSWLNANGQPETVKADVIRRIPASRMRELQSVLMAAVNEGMHMESEERANNDDEYLAEARKNAEGGVEAAN